MIEHAWQKRALAIRRDKRDREREGWEYVGEGGGRLWELERGCRIGHRIAEVRIAASGRGVWIKTTDQFAQPLPATEE